MKILFLMALVFSSTSVWADTHYFQRFDSQCGTYTDDPDGSSGRQITFCRSLYQDQCSAYYKGPIEGVGLKVWAKINSVESVVPMKYVPVRSSGWYRADFSCSQKGKLAVEVAFVDSNRNPPAWDSRYGQNYRFSF